jgi:hypothetical protein
MNSPHVLLELTTGLIRSRSTKAAFPLNQMILKLVSKPGTAIREYLHVTIFGSTYVGLKVTHDMFSKGMSAEYLEKLPLFRIMKSAGIRQEKNLPPSLLITDSLDDPAVRTLKRLRSSSDLPKTHNR